MKLWPLRAAWALLALLALAAVWLGAAAPAASPALTVYVVCHAEKDLTPGLPEPPVAQMLRQRGLWPSMGAKR